MNVDRRPISKEEAERLDSPYEIQKALFGTLQRGWDYNAAILRRYGYHVPEGSPYPWSAIPMTQDITEPEAIEAYEVISATCELWRRIGTRDVLAIARAGIWLGRMTCGDTFRQYQRRNSNKERSKIKKRAREIFQSREQWAKASEFMAVLTEHGIETTASQCQKWVTEFRKTTKK